MENRPSSSKQSLILQPLNKILTTERKSKIINVYRTIKEMNPGYDIDQLCKAISPNLGLPAVSIYGIVKEYEIGKPTPLSNTSDIKIVGAQVINAIN